MRIIWVPNPKPDQKSKNCFSFFNRHNNTRRIVKIPCIFYLVCLFVRVSNLYILFSIYYCHYFSLLAAYSYSSWFCSVDIESPLPL